MEKQGELYGIMVTDGMGDGLIHDFWHLMGLIMIPVANLPCHFYHPWLGITTIPPVKMVIYRRNGMMMHRQRSKTHWSYHGLPVSNHG